MKIPRYDDCGQLFYFKSEEKTWTSTQKGHMTFEGFVETKHGEKNRRTIVRGFTVFAELQVDITVANWMGEDKYRIIDSLTLEQKDNVKRWDAMPGDAIRTALHGILGPERVNEFADSAVANNVVVQFSCYIPLAKPRAYDGLDFSMAADVFKCLKIKGIDVSTAGMGATLALDSARYWVEAECYEETEVKQHAVDTIFVQDFESATETKVLIGGRLHDLFIYAPGDEGGQDLDSYTDVRVKELMTEPALFMPELTERFKRCMGASNGGISAQGAARFSSPFVDPGTGSIFAAAILLTNGNQVDDGPELDAVHVKITIGSGTVEGEGTGTPRLICRVVQPTSEKLERAIAKKYGASATTPATGGKPVSADKARYLPKTFLK